MENFLWVSTILDSHLDSNFFFYRTPNEKAERNGLGEVFQAIKEDNCVIFDCETVIK